MPYKKRGVFMVNKVSISTLPFDFQNIPTEFEHLKALGVDYVHCDIMDGVFVENKTYTPAMLKDIAHQIPLPLDVHLMVQDPIKYVEVLKNVAHFFTFHCECFANSSELKNAILIVKQYCKVGVAVDLYTDIQNILDVLPLVDLVLIMSVKAGAGGQEFNDSAIKKISTLNAIRQQKAYTYLIEVDGGINGDNAQNCVKAGADILVSGSYVARANQKDKAIQSLKISID